MKLFNYISMFAVTLAYTFVIQYGYNNFLSDMLGYGDLSFISVYSTVVVTLLIRSMLTDVNKDKVLDVINSTKEDEAVRDKVNSLIYSARYFQAFVCWLILYILTLLK